MAYILIPLVLGLATAWDPVRPGALVKKSGDMIIVNHSVRVLLKFDSIGTIRENVNQIKQALNLVKSKLHGNNTSNERLHKKIDTIQRKVTNVENNFLHTKEKRAIGMAIAIGTLVGLGVTNIGLFMDLRSSVNTLQNQMSRLDTLQEQTDEIQLTIDDLITNMENFSLETSHVKESLELFIILDQLHVRINELNAEMEQLIQDLVMANAGHVTSTLFSIPQLLNITLQAKIEWNFKPFFDSSSIALYYPLLTSFINDTGVLIDIPFSSELNYHIYTLIPFPMQLNGSILSVDTTITSPTNYILSTNGLKESEIENDDLLNCKRTNIDLYLCPATYFTFNEALSHSCPASLVKNLSIVQNCHFKEEHPTPRHHTLQDSHYFYFPNKTTVSVVCPELQPQIAAIEGLYRVPDQCELHSPTLTTVANRKRTIILTQQHVLQDITVKFSERTPPLKIRKLKPKRLVPQVSDTQTSILWYIIYTIPILLSVLLSSFIVTFLYKKIQRVALPVRHISVP